MTISRNGDREVWEGWTVDDFIECLLPISEMLDRQGRLPFDTKESVAKWCVDEQPYYKKQIPEVTEFFIEKYHVK